MNTSSPENLRKAAVLIRSLDADTAATLLGQLSPEEATAIRTAIRALGPLDSDEQADVLAEFQRRRPLAESAANPAGVELELSARAHDQENAELPLGTSGKRFAFLEKAPIEALVPYLSREHCQTIAVVLSHLAPARAAAVLGALPEKLQLKTIERMQSLGDSDPEAVTVLERELSAWLSQRLESTNSRKLRGDAVSAILAAADSKTRDGILRNMQSSNVVVSARVPRPKPAENRVEPAKSSEPVIRREPAVTTPSPVVASIPRPLPPAPRPLPSIQFDDLIHLDNRALAAVLHQSDPNVLALALAGSREELVERICDEMPKRTARTFRRELRRLGPTRLSDVEAAQRAIADIAARQLAARRRPVAA